MHSRGMGLLFGSFLFVARRVLLKQTEGGDCGSLAVERRRNASAFRAAEGEKHSQ